MEEWKDIDGYEGLYKISNKGNVFSVRRNRVRRPKKMPKGYLHVVLVKNKEEKDFLVHRLVALSFIHKDDNQRIYVNHKDGDKENNSVPNLEWVTNQENTDHAHKNGLYDNIKGEKSFFYGKVFKKNINYILDTSTGIYYWTAVEAAIVKGINLNTLKAKLIGRLKNNTSMIYV